MLAVSTSIANDNPSLGLGHVQILDVSSLGLAVTSTNNHTIKAGSDFQSVQAISISSQLTAGPTTQRLGIPVVGIASRPGLMSLNVDDHIALSCESGHGQNADAQHQRQSNSDDFFHRYFPSCYFIAI